MLTQKQRNEINKRLAAISSLSDRTDSQVDKPIDEFMEICGMEDTTRRTLKEQDFQEKLLAIENYITYLNERKKI